MTDGSGNMYWGAPSQVAYVSAGTAGQMPYYETSGSSLTSTSSIYLSSSGYFGIGTTTPSSLLTVGNSLGSQFLVNSSGQIIGGE